MINKHLQLAYQQYEEHGLDWHTEFQWHLAFAHVLCMDDVLCVARPCDTNNLLQRFPVKPNGLYVEYLSYDDTAVRKLFAIFESMPSAYEYIAYYRGFKDMKTSVIPYRSIKKILNKGKQNGWK